MPPNHTPIDHLLKKPVTPKYDDPVLTPWGPPDLPHNDTAVTPAKPNTDVPNIGQFTPKPHSKPQLISLPKEAGPSNMKTESAPLPDAPQIQETVEHEKLEEDVKAFVDVKLQNIKISDELKKLGLQPIEKTKYEGYKNIKLPLSDDKIALGLHAPISSSLRWLATFALYLLQQSHLTLKIIHGKAVRVVKKD